VKDKLHGDVQVFETSAKDAVNVEQAFLSVVRKALEHSEQNDAPVLPTGMSLKPIPAAQPASGGCC